MASWLKVFVLSTPLLFQYSNKIELKVLGCRASSGFRLNTCKCIGKKIAGLLDHITQNNCQEILSVLDWQNRGKSWAFHLNYSHGQTEIHVVRLTGNIEITYILLKICFQPYASFVISCINKSECLKDPRERGETLLKEWEEHHEMKDNLTVSGRPYQPYFSFER